MKLYAWFLLVGAMWVGVHLCTLTISFGGANADVTGIRRSLHTADSILTETTTMTETQDNKQAAALKKNIQALLTSNTTTTTSACNLLGVFQQISAALTTTISNTVNINATTKAEEAARRRVKVKERMTQRDKQRDASEKQEHQEGHAIGESMNFTPRDFSHLPPLVPDRSLQDAPPRIQLPDMTTEKGGVIFFWHIPKTGGHTIRHNFGLGRVQKSAKDVLLGELQPHMREQLLNYHNTSSTQDTTTLFLSKVRFIMANYLDVFLNKAVSKINKYLSSNGTAAPSNTGHNNSTHTKKNMTFPSSNQGRILMVEVHGMDNYHANELEPYLHAWRQRSKESGVPFFAFTLLREAISEQVSFFNFYYLHPGDTRFCNNSITTSTRCEKNHQKRIRDQHKKKTSSGITVFVKPTAKNNSLSTLNKGIDLEDAMIQSVYENPQCLFLARGERTFGDDAAELRQHLGRDECHKTYQSLRRTMDWIGRTETLSNETLPLLTTMMFGSPDVGRQFPKSNISPQTEEFLHLSKLQPKSRSALEAMTAWDQQMYRQTLRDYAMDQWINYNHALGIEAI